MKLFVKVLKISLFVFLISICVLSVAGWLLQDRIVRFAMDEMGTTFGAPLAAEKVSFSLISNFPQASLAFDKIWLGRYKYDDSNEIIATDTLAKFSKLYVSLNARALLDDIIKIKDVEIEDGYVRYAIDSTGAMTYDYLIPADSSSVEEDEPSAPLDLTVEQISLSKFTCIYQDDQLQAKANVFIPTLTAYVKMDEDNLRTEANGAIELSKLKYEETAADRLQKISVAFDIVYDSDTLHAQTFKVNTEELAMEAIGKVFIGDEIYTDLSLSASAPSLSALTKYAPEGMLEEYGISQVAGKLNLNTKLQGVVGDDLPFYDAAIDLANASVKYEDYPLVYNIQLKTSATNGNQRNNSTTAVQLKNFSADCSGNHIDFNGSFSNLDRIKYNINANLSVDLDASKKLIPDTLAQAIGGNIQLKLATNGTAPDSIDSKFVQSVLKNTSASLNIDQMKLKMGEDLNLDKFSMLLDYKDYELSLKNLNASLPDYKVNLINNSIQMSFTGDPLVPESMNLNIPMFHLATNEGSVSGSATLKKMQDLNFAIASDLKLDLKKLKRFAPDSLVNDMSGQLLASVQSKGKLNIDKMEDDQIESILYDNTRFDVKLKDISLDMKDTLMNISNLSGKVKFENQNLYVENFRGTYSKIDFNIESTTVQNFVETALKNRPGTLKVEGVYKFGNLDYRALAAFAGDEEAESTSSKEEEPTAWNYDISGQAFIKSFTYDTIVINGIRTNYDVSDKTNLVKGDVNIDQVQYGTTLVNKFFTKYEMNMSNNEVRGKVSVKDVKYEDALLEDITALYNVNDSTYTIDQMNITAFGGETTSSIQVHLREQDEMEIEMKSTINELNIRILMEEMKNFDQSEMTYEQLNGIVSSDNFYLRMTMIGDSIVYDDLRMTCDLKFHDGGIYHYPPVQDMAQYLPKVDNLDTMTFKTINTHMFLFKDAVYVPRTYVVSNVFDVEAIGMQSFGEDYQYHIGVNLYQILGKKNKTNTDKDEPTKRKKMIRLKATGRKGKYKSGLDKVKDRDAMLTKVKTQEKVLEFRFQPKFFSFETKAEDL